MITNAVVIKTILAMMETELIALARPKSLPICAVKGGLALATGAKNTITKCLAVFQRERQDKIGCQC